MGNDQELGIEDRIAGAIYGMAFGDAWGYPTEFLSHGRILQTRQQPPTRLVVTDDTQMSLYNVRALRTILATEDLSGLLDDPEQQRRIRRIFAEEHLRFSLDPDNDRAPGVTVMGALREYGQSPKLTGLEGSSQNDSKGCGTVMRAPWLGLLPLSSETITALAILQSQTTHGHRAAALSAAAAALFVRGILNGQEAPRLWRTKTSGPKDGALSAVSAVSGLASKAAWLDSSLTKESGLSTFYGEAIDLYSAMRRSVDLLEGLSDEQFADPDADICQWFGGGWVADEALFCAAASFGLYGSSAYDGIQRLVYTSGDSDSIAAIGGSFLGSFVGYEELEGQVIQRGHRIRGAFEPRYEEELEASISFFLELR